MTRLAEKSCSACRGDSPLLASAEIQRLLADLDRWRIDTRNHLTRTFEFPDFASALAFVNRIGAIAEEQGHHPDVHLAWGRVDVQLWTHKVDGLTESDFIMAAKINEARRDG
jgi:4a-hydroxytetrahydrobiopterin dehydratase